MRQPMELAIGQITDDTEMTMVLLQTLIKNSMFLDVRFSGKLVIRECPELTSR